MASFIQNWFDIFSSTLSNLVQKGTLNGEYIQRLLLLSSDAYQSMGEDHQWMSRYFAKISSYCTRFPDVAMTKREQLLLKLCNDDPSRFYVHAVCILMSANRVDFDKSSRKDPTAANELLHKLQGVASETEGEGTPYIDDPFNRFWELFGMCTSRVQLAEEVPHFNPKCAFPEKWLNKYHFSSFSTSSFTQPSQNTTAPFATFTVPSEVLRLGMTSNILPTHAVQAGMCILLSFALVTVLFWVIGHLTGLLYVVFFSLLLGWLLLMISSYTNCQGCTGASLGVCVVIIAFVAAGMYSQAINVNEEWVQQALTISAQNAYEDAIFTTNVTLETFQADIEQRCDQHLRALEHAVEQIRKEAKKAGLKIPAYIVGPEGPNSIFTKQEIAKIQEYIDKPQPTSDFIDAAEIGKRTIELAQLTHEMCGRSGKFVRVESDDLDTQLAVQFEGNKTWYGTLTKRMDAGNFTLNFTNVVEQIETATQAIRNKRKTAFDANVLVFLERILAGPRWVKFAIVSTSLSLLFLQIAIVVKYVQMDQFASLVTQATVMVSLFFIIHRVIAGMGPIGQSVVKIIESIIT